MKRFILPYKQLSKSAKDLAVAVGGKVIRLDPTRSKFKAATNKLVVNWGSSTLSEHVVGTPIINAPEHVDLAADKYTALEAMGCAGVRIPDYTISKETAHEWIKDGSVVLCRTVLRGNSGAGIVIATCPEELVTAPLYTRYIKKKDEFRVHVFNGNVIHIQQKKRKLDVPDDQVDWKIRNHKNGFVFAQEDVTAPDDVVAQAVKAVDSLHLHFGAVDVIWNEHLGEAYVLEVNTAPGLEGTTLEKYKQAILEICHV
ncbi:RimK family alpha-L-glutamate ligase [Zhongshania sp.]|uniref:ATP-grasp domain-containing protein n=1 Tax=Zhongshania sp. TaxID=1971902 RepID=UPI0035698944